MASYFRTWRDYASNPLENKTSMGELPGEVDIAFVFPQDEDRKTFWRTLKAVYVPALRARGTEVVRTVDVSRLFDPTFDDSQDGYDQLAQHLYETCVAEHGLDGLDVDVERGLTTEELRRATGVFQALSRRLGPASGTGKLLVYDTNQEGTTALFTAVHALVDYVLVQSYGRSSDPASLQRTFDTYADKIPPSRYMIGFSFYEERGPRWRDVTPPIETSRAYAYARWNPTQGAKAGIFSYAVDRDGVLEGNDAIVPTDYTWTKTLKHAM
jgi:hypothetical protein